MVYFLGSEPTGNNYPDFQALDGDESKIEPVDMTPEERAMMKHIDFIQSGRRLKPDHMISQIEWRSKQEVPDVSGPLISKAVTDRLKDIVEQFEPDVHQWFPLEFVDRQGTHLAHRWYFFSLQSHRQC